MAYIVRKEFSYISSSDVAEFVKTRSAPYKQLAGGVEFIQEIPKSAAGKILRKVRLYRSRRCHLFSEIGRKGFLETNSYKNVLLYWKHGKVVVLVG